MTVSAFREILFWPLRLEAGMSGSGAAAILAEERSPWRLVPDNFKREVSTPEDLAYSEFVYFHPFAHRFFYGKDSAMQIFRRDDIGKVRVTLKKGSGTPPIIDLAVPRVEMYLFEDMGIAIIVMEVMGQDISLKDCQNLLDQLRRVYPPYWDSEPPYRAGHCPEEVKFFTCAGGELAVSDFLNYKDAGNEKSGEGRRRPFLDFARRHQIPPVAAHWRYLAAPLVFDPEGTHSLLCRQIVDDRMPHMAHIAVKCPPHFLSRGDMIRLGLADEQGKSSTLPYASNFLENFEKDHCYDRFWETTLNKPGWLSTRYIVTDYSFTAIGRWEQFTRQDGSKSDGFFINSANGGLAHFRHHYFLMFLVTVFYRSVLLTLSDELSAKAVSIRTLEGGKNRKRENFHDQIRHILHNQLTFTHRYWFPELSNQVQGRELFAMIRRHMDLDNLFDKVNREGQELYEYLETEFQSREADLTSRLTVVATFGLGCSIVMAFWGMNIIVDREACVSQRLAEWGLLGGSLLIFVLLTGLVLMTAKTIARAMDTMGRKGEKLVDWLTRTLNRT